MTDDEKKIADTAKHNVGSQIDGFLMSSLLGKILLIAFFVIFVFQCVFICYYNLTQIEYHVSYDASVDFLQAIEMWETKSLILEQWEYTTSLKLDSGIPLAALLYGITGDIFISFGMVNILIAAAMVFLFWVIAKEIGLSQISALITLNMFLLPYTGANYNVANPLDYFTCMFFSCGYYAVSVLTVLLGVLVVIRLNRNDFSKSTIVYAVISLFLFMVAGVSKGMTMMIYFALPGLLYALFESLLNNTFRNIFCKRNLYFVFVILVTFIGVVIAALVTTYENRSGDMNLIGFEKFWSNLGALLLGLPILMEATTFGTYVGVVSFGALPYLCNILLYVLLVFSIAFVSVKCFKNREWKTNTNLLFLICLCLVDYFIFALMDSKAGSQIFEARYLIFMFVCGLWLVGMFVDRIKDNLVFKRLLLSALAVVILVSGCNSYYWMTKRKGAYGAELVEVFAKYDAHTVYGLYTTENNREIMIRNLRVLDTSKIYKQIDSYNCAHHWGDYTYRDDISDVPEGGVLLFIKAEELAAYPKYVQDAFVLKETLEYANVYYAEKAIFDLVSGLPKFDDHSIDLPTSANIHTKYGSINDSGAFVTDGSEGHVLYGPYEKAIPGVYEFKLNYKSQTIDIQNVGTFEIVVNNGSKVLAKTSLNPESNFVTVTAEFVEGDVFEYRVYCVENAIFEIGSIEMTRVSK